MEASCGPTNALQNLSKHAQRDNSLQQEFSRGPQQFSGNFKQSNIVDQNLNQDFNQFNNNDFSNSFMNQFNPQQFKNQMNLAQFSQNMNQNQIPQNHMNQNHLLQHQIPQNTPQQSFQSKPQQSWVNDFSQLSINHQQNQVNHQPSFNHFQPYQPNLSLRNATPMYPQPEKMVEHQEIHKYEQSIDEQFDLVEKELNQQEQPVEEQNHDHEQFAKTARDIETTMKQAASQNSELGEKFQNSEFLKLMQSISTRNVELEGDKLVDSKTKQDIREIPEETKTNQTVPMESQNKPDYHDPQLLDIPVPMRQEPPQPQEARGDQVNKLPDPLAHIADGSLSDINDPLIMAQVISGGQVKRKEWLNADTDWLDATYTAPPRRQRISIMSEIEQQVYDDYRHDDDFH